MKNHELSSGFSLLPDTLYGPSPLCHFHPLPLKIERVVTTVVLFTLKDWTEL